MSTFLSRKISSRRRAVVDENVDKDYFFRGKSCAKIRQNSTVLNVRVKYPNWYVQMLHLAVDFGFYERILNSALN